MKTSKKSEQLFVNPFLEKLSHTNALLVIITLFIISLIILAYGIIYEGGNILSQLVLYISGFIFFTLVEYLIHRFIFHSGDYSNKKTWQFKIHGIHHANSKDKERLAMPLPLAILIASIFFSIYWLIMKSYVFFFFPGFLLGYTFYLSIHFIIHTKNPPQNNMRFLWKNHAIHHHKHDNKMFGVTTPFWDIIFKTMPLKETQKTIKSHERI
jgi:4-hydroxysphinganine ceramide fatty acyl 2-hydroxylase